MRNSTETITVKANQSKRTFTIRKYVDGKFSVKYRTMDYNAEEFESMECMVESDWKNFLRTRDEYYVVK